LGGSTSSFMSLEDRRLLAVGSPHLMMPSGIVRWH
jgi:hypothetical protein